VRQKPAKFINYALHGINMAKRKSKKKSAKKSDPLTTPIHWDEGDIIKKAAIVKLFPKDTMVQPIWGGREGKLQNLLTDPEYTVVIARVNKDKTWRSYSILLLLDSRKGLLRSSTGLLSPSSAFQMCRRVIKDE